MQIALRPVAFRLLLLIAGIALGLVAFLTAYAAATSSHGNTAAATSSHGATISDDGGRTILAGTHWN
jgi:hypothetical protein